MMGMYLMRMIGNLGQYHQADPRFPGLSGLSRLPPFWKPFSSFPFALLMAFLLPGVLAAIFGFLAFRSRIRGVYFSILTQALTYAACLLFFRNSLLLGGNNGFTDFKFILGHDLRDAGDSARPLYRHGAGAAVGLPGLPLAEPNQIRPGPASHPRQRKPGALQRLRGRLLQAVCLCALRADRRAGRRPLRAAGRHHQSQRNGARTNRWKRWSGSPWAGAAR